MAPPSLTATQSTRTDLAPVFKPEQPLSPEEECKRKGWIWDKITQSCVNPSIKDPTNKTTSPVTQQVPTKKPEVITDQTTGKLTGVVKPDGSSYVGISPQDVRAISGQVTKDTQLPQGTEPLGTAVMQAQAQQQAEMLASQIAQSSGIQGIQKDINGNFIDGNGTPINWKQVGYATAADKSAWTTIGTLAAGGAYLGSLAAPGAGTVIGIIGGALLGLGVSTLSNIRSQKSDNLQAQKISLTNGQTNLNKLTLLVQADPARAPEYIDGFNAQLDKIAQAYANLRADASSDLNLITAQDGTTELARFANFYAQGGAAEYYKQKMALAIAAPNSQAALMELAVVQQSIGEGQ